MKELYLEQKISTQLVIEKFDAGLRECHDGCNKSVSCFDVPALTVQISLHQEHNLDWFPRMRAMSLVSSDADGEQNEIRNLQEKLESTMKLVSNLSGQLTELKEQVGETEGTH